MIWTRAPAHLLAGSLCIGLALAKGSPKVQGYLNGKEPRVFVVPGKLVNLVV